MHLVHLGYPFRAHNAKPEGRLEDKGLGCLGKDHRVLDSVHASKLRI